MKISNDQNRIELDDGTVLLAKSAVNFVSEECQSACASCELRPLNSLCKEAPCCPQERNDRRDVIFIKEQPNA
ncbi:MAG: hypothetical protein ACRC8W_12500 [Plesiomonas shigelloides]